MDESNSDSEAYAHEGDWSEACETGAVMNPILITFSQCTAGTRFAGRLLLFAAVILAFAAGSTSCSTTRGLGEDIETTGDKIQEAATR